MRAYLCVLFILTVGCAPRPATAPAAPSHPRYKTDLGYLDDPRVQELVAAREENRMRIMGMYSRFASAVVRQAAFETAYTQILPLVPGERVTRCHSNAYLFEAWISRLKSDLKVTADQSDELVAIVQKGGYGLHDNKVAGLYDGAELMLRRTEQDVDAADLSLKKLFVCLEVQLIIRHPMTNEVLFQTTVEM